MNADEINVIKTALDWMDEALSLLHSQFGNKHKMSILHNPITEGEHPEIAALRKLLANHSAT